MDPSATARETKTLRVARQCPGDVLLTELAPGAKRAKAAVTWVESCVRDPPRRETLSDLDLICCRLAEISPDSRDSDRAFKTYAKLLRIWAET